MASPVLITPQRMIVTAEHRLIITCKQLVCGYVKNAEQGLIYPYSTRTQSALQPHGSERARSVRVRQRVVRYGWNLDNRIQPIAS